MLSTENPAEPSCSSKISALKSDEKAQEGLDLIKSCSDHKEHHSFSIRDYVLDSRSKNIEANWPFPHRYLQLCLKHGLKDVLPPFDPPDYVRTHYSRKNIGVDSPITSPNGKENCRDFDPSSVLASSSGTQSPSEEKEPITEPVSFSLSETLTSNLCPVCKTFSSISNTTLNAHMDQCLSMESAFAIALPKQFKHKVKPRKIKSMVDIYATAPPGTLEDLDKRNGTSWAFDPCKASVNEMTLEKKKESHSKLVIIEDENDDSSSGNLDCNGKKVRILTELNDSIVLPKAVDDASLKDMKNNNKVKKMFRRKKHLLSKCSKTLKAKSLIRKSCSLNSKVREKCGKKFLISIREDKEKSLSQFCKAPERVRTSTGETLSQWVRSKRSSVSRRFNNNAVKKTFECPIQATRNSLNHRNAFNIDSCSEKKTLSTQSYRSSGNSNLSARFKKQETIANSFYSSVNDEDTQKHENILSSTCNTCSSLKNHKIDFPRNQMQSKRIEPVHLTTSPTEASEKSVKRVTRSSNKLLSQSSNLKIILSNKDMLRDESFLTDTLLKTTSERTSKPVSTQEGQSRIRSGSRLHCPGSSCHKKSIITRRAHILKGIPCSQIRGADNEAQYKQAETMPDIPEVDYVSSNMGIVDTEVRFASRFSTRDSDMECISNGKNVGNANLMSNESSIRELAILDSCKDNVIHIRECEGWKVGEIPASMDVDSTNETSADNIIQSDKFTRKAEFLGVNEVPTFENYYSASDMNLVTQRNADLEVLQTNSSLYSSNVSLDDNSNKLDETCTPLESPVSGLSTISLEPQVLSHDKLTAIDLDNNVESLLGYGLPSVRRSEEESTKLGGGNNSSMTNALSLITALVSVSQRCCCSHRSSCMNHCCGAHGCSISCLKQEISSLFDTLPSLPNSTLCKAYLENNVAPFTGCNGSNLSAPASGVSFQPITSNPVLRLMGKNLMVANKDIDDSLQYQDASPTACHPKSKDLNILGLSKENFVIQERTIRSGGQSAYVDAVTSNNSQDKSNSTFSSSYERYIRSHDLQRKAFGTTSQNEFDRDRLHDQHNLLNGKTNLQAAHSPARTASTLETSLKLLSPNKVIFIHESSESNYVSPIESDGRYNVGSRTSASSTFDISSPIISGPFPITQFTHLPFPNNSLCNKGLQR